MIKKRDGTHRFCLDYCKLNAVTKADVFPLPWINNLLDQLGWANIFSSQPGVIDAALNTSNLIKCVTCYICTCVHSNMLYLPCCSSMHLYSYKQFVHNDVCISQFNSLCQCTLMASELFSVICGVVGEAQGYCLVQLAFQFRHCQFHQQC